MGVDTLENASKADFYENPPRWSGYTITKTPLSILGADPSIGANWVSPSTNVISESGDFVKEFDYTTNPGSVTFVGDGTYLVECTASLTLTADDNFVGGRLKWALNNTPESEPERYIYREISTGTDAGAVSVKRSLIMTTGDYVDFFFGADAVATINIEKAEWSVRSVARIS